VSTTSVSISKIESSDGELTNARYGVWKYALPLPPDGLLWSTGAASVENFLVLGDAWSHLVDHFIPEHATILDIGCGCGRTARALIKHRWIDKYIGFDVVKTSIKWCNNFLAPVSNGLAEFHWFDLYSAEYNPLGAIRAEQLSFPAGDRSVDVVFACSLFTHLLEPDAIHYLQEIGRVLSGRGTAILSIHNNPLPGTRFSGNEARADISSEYFAELARSAGLGERERIDDFGGQQVFILNNCR
jgi:SAM-dependent methyltransferase